MKFKVGLRELRERHMETLSCDQKTLQVRSYREPQPLDFLVENLIVPLTVVCMK